MENNPPKVFISYSHDSPGHKQWILKLASDLRKNGINAVLDQWDLSPGEDITRFMESGLSSADRVIVICSEQYVVKANDGKGGVGYEKMIVSAEIIENLGTKKFIPIIRKAGNPPVPKFWDIDCILTLKMIIHMQPVSKNYFGRSTMSQLLQSLQ